ncbi:MAG: AmmeMemoRadiSam system protein B [candidate division WOR-3 bacterium]
MMKSESLTFKDKPKRPDLIGVWLLSLVIFTLNQVQGNPPQVAKKEGIMREPAVAGQFYPGSKETLDKTVTKLLNSVTVPKITGKIIGIVAPHAGYEYSGQVAAHSYKLIANLDYKTVIIIGPSHRTFFEGAAVYSQGIWKTPLGEVAIDSKLAQAIINHNPKLIKDLPQAHKLEHSLEVQLPFLQKTLKDFKIVPIMLLEPTFQDCQVLADALSSVIKDNSALLLASSDLYHGYSYDECVATDKRTLGLIEKMDAKALFNALKTGEAQACGGMPIVVVILACQKLGANKAKVLKSTNSNEVTGEIGGYCVGYGSVVFYQSQAQEGKKPSIEEMSGTIGLSPEEKKELLKIARTTLEKHIRKEKIPEFKPSSEKLKEKRGVFVTLKKHGELRGCIGYVEGIKPTYEAVKENAINASTNDPRFSPVRPEELKDIDIEITVMTPLQRITDPKVIEVGKHGILIKRGWNQGLLLPQVATEYGWNREEFLAHTCLKAGLPINAWKEKDTEIYIFSGEVFGEKE